MRMPKPIFPQATSDDWGFEEQIEFQILAKQGVALSWSQAYLSEQEASEPRQESALEEGGCPAC